MSKNMRKKLDVKLEVQEPKRENNTFIDFYVTSGEIVVSDKWKHFMPYVFVNGEEYSETFFENLRVVVDTKEKGWPECLPFRLIWDENKKNTLKGITVYYDFLVFRKDGYYPENGLSSNDVMNQRVHFEIQ